MSIKKFIGICICGAFVSGCSTSPSPTTAEKELFDFKFRSEFAPNSSMFAAGNFKNQTLNNVSFPTIADDYQISTLTSAKTKTTTKRDSGGNISIVEADVVISGGSTSTETGTYVFYSAADSFKLVEQLNHEKNRPFLEWLMRFDEPRIVTHVGKVVDHNYDGSTTSKASLKTVKELDIFGKAIQGGLSTSSDSTRAVKYSEGTVFAYTISRFCWERNDDNKIVLGSLDVDRPGRLDNDCPRGTVNDLKDIK